MSVKLPHMNNALVSLGFDQIADYDLESDSDGSPQISEWRSSSPQPTQSEIETAHAAWVTEYESQAYARTRETAYPTIGDQLDMLWHAVDTGDWTAAKVKTTSFYTELKAVKDATPKP